MTFDDFGITVALGKFVQGVERLKTVHGQEAIRCLDPEIHAVEGEILLDRLFGISGIGRR
ncbi:hypothetical protein D3C87_1762820 [compost metagenome]